MSAATPIHPQAGTPAPTKSPLLEVKGLKVSYGHIEAVKGIDFALHEGQITTLVGANGAGKSTLMKVLTGLMGGWQGRVTLGDTPLRPGDPDQQRSLAAGRERVDQGEQGRVDHPAHLSRRGGS